MTNYHRYFVSVFTFELL